MNIVLTGFMASGKTEISKAIAAISKYTLIDTDDMIVEAAGMSINDIFEQYGEDRFREIEHECIRKAAAMDNMVIATGGGVVLNKENVKELRKNGKIFNLAPDFSVIEERLSAAAETRPLLKGQDIEAVRRRFNDRLPFYADCDCKVRVISGRSPKSYAMEILEQVK
jgi:shikimate kinase